MSEHEKKEEKPTTQEKVIENQEREETEPQAQTINWAWAANIKKIFEDALNAATAQIQQDLTRRNTANGTLDKLDAIFTTDLAARLAIEREDMQARLTAERTNAEQMRSNERIENKAKDLLFNNSLYYQMNWLYEFTDLALIDYLKSLNDKIDEIKAKVVVKTP